MATIGILYCSLVFRFARHSDVATRILNPRRVASVLLLPATNLSSSGEYLLAWLVRQVTPESPGGYQNCGKIFSVWLLSEFKIGYAKVRNDDRRT
jgi:hypothetical protein